VVIFYIQAMFLRTGCEDREYRFAEVFFVFCFFSFFFCGRKFGIWGQNIFIQIRLKKQMDNLPLIFLIFSQVLE